jgi:hypothetical protein
MSELARLYTQIALMQRGPQELPASVLLLVLTVCGYFVVNAGLSALLPTAHWLPALLLGMGFTLVWYVLLLRAARRAERVLQTTTAVFGLNTVLSPFMVPANWLFARFSAEQAWPPWLLVGVIVLTVWTVAANSQVLRAALEWSTIACVLLVLAEMVVEVLIVSAIIPVAAVPGH